jgi:TRAP-type C4-dicarboxylate transport system substrate-binding protein
MMNKNEGSMTDVFKKATLAIFLSVVAITPAAASDKKYNLNLALEAGDKDSPQGKSAVMWSEEISQRSDGRIKVNVFYQGELGGQQELFNHLVQGTVDMYLGLAHTSYDERLVVNYLPYLVFSWEDAISAYAKDGWLTKIITPIFDEIGLKYIGPYPEGFGGVATKGKYATTFEQASQLNIKVRSQPVFPMPQTMDAMGYQAVPIDWAEVYTSIQTGVVDGDSGNIIYWDYQYFRDQIDYFVHTKQNFTSPMLLMNLGVWESFDEEDRKIISDAADLVVEKQFKNARSEDQKWIDKSIEEGIEYIVPTEDEMRALIKKVREEVWPLAEQQVGKETMDLIRANASLPQ